MVKQLSVNRILAPSEHFVLGQALVFLRGEGVLIIASGNIVHNLGLVRFDLTGGHPECIKLDQFIKESTINKSFENIINYQQLYPGYRLSVPTTDHFDPLFMPVVLHKKTIRLKFLTNLS